MSSTRLHLPPMQNALSGLVSIVAVSDRNWRNKAINQDNAAGFYAFGSSRNHETKYVPCRSRDSLTHTVDPESVIEGVKRLAI